MTLDTTVNLRERQGVSYSRGDVLGVVRLKGIFRGIIEGYTCCYANKDNVPEIKGRKNLTMPLKSYLREMRKYKELFEEERREVIYLIRKINGASFEMERNKKAIEGI